MINIYDPNFKIDKLKEISGEELGELIWEYPEIAPMLPEGLKVKGDLDLDGCSLKSLPKRLKVEGYLDLYGCSSLKSLPKKLKVGWDLWIGGCPAKVLPDTKIGGKIIRGY